MSFSYQLVPKWPRQAWIASWDLGSDEILVRHGQAVETNADWFGEIVWDGEFEHAGFDETDIVFGSGAKHLGQRKVVFVSSATTLDRLHRMQVAGKFFVSNTLVGLLEATNSEVPADYFQYVRDFKSIISGRDWFEQSLQTSNGLLQLTYYNNLSWDGQRLGPSAKPKVTRQRDSFLSYKSFLEQTLKACAANMSSSARKTQLEYLGTASTGFDSTTVAALGREAGLKNAISISSSRSGQDDSGEKISKRLELEPIVFGRDDWRKLPFAEVPFLAADAKGEDVYFAPAEQELRNKVLLTGYCGSVWGGRGRNYFDFRRTDQSGLSLSEFRLAAGFINMPVATFGVFQADDLLALMQSDETERWSSGRTYDKPFCRYVLTEADVPTDWYGNQKKAASILIEDRQSFLPESSRDDFQRYLATSLAESAQRRLRVGGRLAVSNRARQLASVARAASRFAARQTGSKLLGRIANSLRLNEYANGDPQFQLLFPWAVDRARRQYAP